MNVYPDLTGTVPDTVNVCELPVPVYESVAGAPDPPLAEYDSENVLEPDLKTAVKAIPFDDIVPDVAVEPPTVHLSNSYPVASVAVTVSVLLLLVIVSVLLLTAYGALTSALTDDDDRVPAPDGDTLAVTEYPHTA